ncbi:Sushi, von Willebrand factor type A, EGF and pentraxin domain-containing protein 1 [Bulinus truncatus]|nr:Sushi, von Willebrand factor type A, EGF and pentraxin domain-containing protein 1 [Bulinus truncatus]
MDKLDLTNEFGNGFYRNVSEHSKKFMSVKSEHFRVENKMSRSLLWYLVPIFCWFQFSLTSDQVDTNEDYIEQGRQLILDFYNNYTSSSSPLTNPVDLVFVLDRSASVTRSGWQSMVRFVHSFLEHFTVDADNTRVAVITYGTTASIDVDGVRAGNYNKCALVARLQRHLAKKFPSGYSATHDAIMKAKEVVVDSRRDAKKAVIVITDGKSNIGPPPVRASVQLRSLVWDSDWDVSTKGPQLQIYAFGIKDAYMSETANQKTGRFSAIPDTAHKCHNVQIMPTAHAARGLGCTSVSVKMATKGMEPIAQIIVSFSLDHSFIQLRSQMEVNTVKMKVNTVKMEVNTVKMKVNTGKMEVNTVKMEVNTVKMKVNTVKMKVNTVKMEVNTVKMKVNTVKMEVNTVKMKVNTVKLKVNTVKMEVNTVKMKVNTVKLKVNTVKMEVNTVKMEVNTVKMKVNTVKMKLFPLLFIFKHTACPRGTYKSNISPLRCHSCPANSTTLAEGATDSMQCVCEPPMYQEASGQPCHVRQCIQLPDIDHGIKFHVSGRVVDEVSKTEQSCTNMPDTSCHYHCDEGYRLNGHPGLVCNPNGTWEGVVPECQIVDCSSVDFHHQQVLHGDVTYLNGTTTYGSKLRVVCQEGYRAFGDTVRTCTHHGTWSGTRAWCVENKCPALPLTPGLVITPVVCGQSALPPGSECLFECESGYVINGPASVSCTDKGAWNGSSETFCTDKQPPVIVCPDDLTTPITEANYALLHLRSSGARVTDNSNEYVVETVGFGDGPVRLTAGLHQFKYIARDKAGNEAQCFQSITVVVILGKCILLMSTEVTDKCLLHMSTEVTDKCLLHMSTEVTDKCLLLMSTEVTDKCLLLMSTEVTDKCLLHMSTEETDIRLLLMSTEVTDKCLLLMSTEVTDKCLLHMSTEETDTFTAHVY